MDSPIFPPRAAAGPRRPRGRSSGCVVLAAPSLAGLAGARVRGGQLVQPMAPTETADVHVDRVTRRFVEDVVGDGNAADAGEGGGIVWGGFGGLMREQWSDRERELSIYRSGSAPPTVEGSLTAVNGMLGHSGESSMSEEEIRSDPAYISYYYSNGNLNPRLPPPLLSKEDWRRKGSRVEGIGGGGSRSLFSLQPGFGSEKEESEIDQLKKQQQQQQGSGAEWGGDGLIGLTGFELGGRKKSLADFFQDDVGHVTPVSRHPSRPASRNAYGDGADTMGSVELQPSQLDHELGTIEALRAVRAQGTTASHTYASALGASLSRSNTPDPQLIARAPSPLPPLGGGRLGSSDMRSINAQNSFNGNSSSMCKSVDLSAALSGMNLSTNGVVDDENHLQPHIHQDIDDHHNFLFNLQSDQNNGHQNPYPKKTESAHLPVRSVPQSMKPSSYSSLGKRNGVGLESTNAFLTDEQVELHKVVGSSASSYLNSPSMLSLNSGGGSPSHYQGIDGANSAFANYGLGTHSINSSPSSMLASQLGNGNMPPLFENVAAASALAAAGMDSRLFGGSLPSGTNLMGAAELHNLNRMGNHNGGNGLQVPVMDPLYVQYLRSAEYAAAQVAAISDPSLDRSYMGNSYVDLVGLQKAYLGALLSPQKSQYSLPFLGKSGGFNHGYHGNPSFGLGMSYPGSPLASPVVPNSPVGPGSPIRHERSLRFPSGIRGMGGNFMGPWHSDSVGSISESFASSLLEEFKSSKTKCFELSEIAGHVVEFSADQYGSRFIQQKLETATIDEKNMVFQEIMPHSFSLMTDVFGNYVIQKFFEHGTASQRRELADQLTGHVLTLSLQMYGCRVIQKAIEVVDLDQQTQMVAELEGHVMRCVRDQNGNHVIQKCIECIPQDAIQFIISSFYDQVVTLSMHPYGCRVIQRVLEYCSEPKTQQIMMDEILLSVCKLAKDQYGNYVVQHVLEHGKPYERSAIIKKLAGQIVEMSQQKFASNVVEKCLTFGGASERQILVNEMLGTTDENEPLQVSGSKLLSFSFSVLFIFSAEIICTGNEYLIYLYSSIDADLAMMKDQFANYVVQKVLETCDDQQRELILSRIKVHLNALKKYTYGKHIVARVEKLVAAGERRSSIQSPYLS
ncbi:hypothetical protein Scep_005407 [Stephania cephalantha]|uniref:PUM-HD domain-containing protein n=1 Tax=Stephania cephalantha TaxID=152367 RepID=A0AAP0KU83_9MAGN